MIGSHDDGCAVGGDDTRLQHTARIRDLNDRYRATMGFRFIYVTVSVRALGVDAASQALRQVRTFTAFIADNDPWREHDFGAMTVAGEQLFWKIDYYDPQLEQGSPDPGNDAVTARVLTVVLASDY